MQASEPARGAERAAPPAPSMGEAAVILAPVGAQDPVTARGPERFSNRELSWLEFGARLLDLAGDEAVPLLERVKFLAIFSEGLDEFFQVRVAGLKDQVDAGLRTRSADGLRPSEALRAIGERVTELVDRQSRIFLDSVVPALAEAGVRVADWSSLDDADREHLTESFNRQIFPVLTPLSVDPGHPFPYISNLSLNLIVRVGDPITGVERVARVKVPPLLPRFVVMPDDERFVALEQIIAAQLATLFPDMVIGEHYAFRVTRNADLVLEEDEADDLLAAVEMELRRRRFGRAVRLEVAAEISDDMRDMLVHELDLGPDDRYEIAAPLDLGGLWGVYELDRPDLHEEAWAPMTPPRLANAGNETADLFAVLRERDVLVHHPYDSFTTSVEAFIAQAAADPDVLAIKQTLYRTSGDSPIVGLAHPGRRGGQAGGGGGRAQSTLRRAGEHLVGPSARGGRRARRLRARGAQDPLQGRPGGAARGGRDPSLLPRGHRELQPPHGSAVRRPRTTVGGPRARRRRGRPVQLPHRL